MALLSGTVRAETAPWATGVPGPVELRLAVLVKRSDGASEILRGEPMHVRVQLSNVTAQEDHQRYREWAKRQRDLHIVSGRPGRANVRVFTARESTVVRLPARDNGWAGAVELTIERSQPAATGAAPPEPWRNWKWTQQLKPDRRTLESTAQLDTRTLSATWSLGPEKTQSLAPGKYTLRARYDTSGLAEAPVVAGPVVGVGTFEIVDTPRDKEEGARLSLAQAWWNLKAGDPDKAIANARKAISFDPGHDQFMAYDCLGLAYERKGMAPEAIAAYEDFLKHNPHTHRWIYPERVRQRLFILKQNLETK